MKFARLRWSPLLALTATIVVMIIGARGLHRETSAIQTVLVSSQSAQELEAIATGIEEINGTLYHVLTLQAAQTKNFNGAVKLHAMIAQTDGVISLMHAWNNNRATPAQVPVMDALIKDVEKYKGALDFVGQMLDVDFNSAVSFLKPFDDNFLHLTQSVQSLLNAERDRRQADADGARRAA